MAYPNPGSMSPPPKPIPPPLSTSSHSFSPYQSAGSPGAASPHAPPPAKRQRLSPDIRSPPNGVVNYASSSPAPPVGAYGNPYATPSQPGNYGASPQPSFNVPQPYHVHQMQWQSQPSSPATAGGRQGSPTNPQSQSSQMMPPPPRPNKEEKDDKISADDIGDSLFGSGINLKEEENYMHSTFNNRHAADSFASQTTASSGHSSANNSFNMLTQGTSFDSQGDGPFAGTMGSTLSQEDIEIQERRKRAQAATARNEARQFHLQNQFLNANCVRRRMDVRSANEGVVLPTLGLYVRSEPETRVAVHGSGTPGIVSVRPECVVEQGSQFDNLLSLVSLAANERVRTLLIEAFALSRARRYGDHGRVPPEFAEIASGDGKMMSEKLLPENVTGTQWDRLPVDADQETNGNPDSKTTDLSAQPTISFQGKINSNLRQIAERDRQDEKERAKKRETRRRQAENNATTEDGAGADGVSAEAGADTPVKMTKKEQAKQAKAAASAAESESHTTTNQTAAMMALGKKGARYKWMSGGAAAMPTNRFAKSAGNSGTSTPTIKAEDGTGTAALSRAGSGQGVKAPEWGDFREDGPSGRGIQARDWALVLERDGKEKKALQRVLNKLGSS